LRIEAIRLKKRPVCQGVVWKLVSFDCNFLAVCDQRQFQCKMKKHERWSYMFIAFVDKLQNVAISHCLYCEYSSKLKIKIMKCWVLNTDTCSTIAKIQHNAFSKLSAWLNSCYPFYLSLPSVPFKSLAPHQSEAWCEAYICTNSMFGEKTKRISETAYSEHQYPVKYNSDQNYRNLTIH